MTGGNESAARDKDGGTALIAQIPIGWQRKVQDGAVSYISPSGSVLRSVDEVRVYLRTDGTCKCGLECPLVINKVFSFDPAAMVQAPGHQSGKIEEDMTKLCNHRRKVDAMAALCQSMQPPQLPPTGDVVCSMEGRESRGSIGEGTHCTYSQPKHNQPKSSIYPLTSPRSVLHNGSVSHLSRPLEPSSPLKKPSCQTPVGSNAPVCLKQQWNPHPHLPLSQNILQRTVHNPTSPSNNSLFPNSFSACPSPTGQAAHQGGSVKSSSPLSVCSSPSRALESFSPHRRSRHSSTSSLSEQGASGSIFIQGVKPSPPTVPCSSPKLPFTPTSPCGRLEGMLQHYKDCSTTNTNTAINNQSNLQMSHVASPAHPNPSDKRNGVSASPLNSAQASNLLTRPLGQQKNQQNVSNSFPASNLLSAAAKAQKTQSQLNTVDAQSAVLEKEQQSKGSLSSPALVSTSVSCCPLAPPSGQEVCDPITEQDKNTHFLPHLIGPGVLGDLTALHSLLGTGPLLLPQGSSLMTQNQTALNPLTCLQLAMGPTLMTEKSVNLHESPPSQQELPSAHTLNSVQTPAHQREGSTGSGTGLFDPYGSFMDTIYTSFLQVSERTESGSDSTPLSYPELPPLLQQASAPHSLSPRRACSVHNQDLSCLGMETAQSPARGTPKPSEEPSTPPPNKPAGVDTLSDAPLQSAFMEEAKTDGSSKVCLYSNGIGSGMEGRAENNKDEEDDYDVGRGRPAYLSPGERALDDITEQERTEDMHTGAKRGRKRKQSLQRGAELPEGIDSIIEEPTVTKTLSRPARSTRGKRRRVVR